MAEADPNETIGSLFAAVVAVRIDGHWHFVETVEQAFLCLSDNFSPLSGASYTRALETYEVFRAGRIAAESVQAAFVVAAMATGYPFEILHRNEALLERKVAAMAEQAVLAAFP